MRVVFLWYSSDPMVFYDPLSLFRAQVGMTEPPVPVASRLMRFIPAVTQFQLALDMSLAFGTTTGHSHTNYAQDYIVPRLEVSAPEGGTDEDTARLETHRDSGFQNGRRNHLRGGRMKRGDQWIGVAPIFLVALLAHNGLRGRLGWTVTRASAASDCAPYLAGRALDLASAGWPSPGGAVVIRLRRTATKSRPVGRGAR